MPSTPIADPPASGSSGSVPDAFPKKTVRIRPAAAISTDTTDYELSASAVFPQSKSSIALPPIRFVEPLAGGNDGGEIDRHARPRNTESLPPSAAALLHDRRRAVRFLLRLCRHEFHRAVRPGDGRLGRRVSGRDRPRRPHRHGRRPHAGRTVRRQYPAGHGTRRVRGDGAVLLVLAVRATDRVADAELRRRAAARGNLRLRHHPHHAFELGRPDRLSRRARAEQPVARGGGRPRHGTPRPHRRWRRDLLERTDTQLRPHPLHGGDPLARLGVDPRRVRHGQDGETCRSRSPKRSR